MVYMISRYFRCGLLLIILKVINGNTESIIFIKTSIYVAFHLFKLHNLFHSSFTDKFLSYEDYPFFGVYIFSYADQPHYIF